MRWPGSIRGLGLGLAVAAAGCGNDLDETCATSYLTYETFGAPFMTSWCRGCHSRNLPEELRQQAPPNVDFDTREDVRRFSHRVRARAGAGRSMPPAGGPSEAERALLVEWLRCGAP
jgi:uncharacterized membrane protein